MSFISNLFHFVSATATETENYFFFEPVNFVKNLQYMGIGMLVIFVVIGVIILTTLLVNKIFSK